MKKQIIWSQDASKDFIETITYIKEKSGKDIATKIYQKIILKIEQLENFPESGRLVPELSNIGVLSIREIIEKPWRIFYRITSSEIQIISLIDGRRNIQEILYNKVIDGKI